MNGVKTVTAGNQETTEKHKTTLGQETSTEAVIQFTLSVFCTEEIDDVYFLNSDAEANLLWDDLEYGPTQVSGYAFKKVLRSLPPFLWYKTRTLLGLEICTTNFRLSE